MANDDSEKGRRKLVHLLSPHSDDVALSLGGSLLRGALGDVRITTVFSISDYTINDEGLSAKEVTEIRKEEDRVFFSHLPGEPAIVYLDRLDAPLRRGIHHERTIGLGIDASDEREAASVAVPLIGDASAGTLILSPLGIGGHVDHLVVRRAAIEVSRVGYPVGFYEDLPYTAGLRTDEIASLVERIASREGMVLKPFVIPYGEADRKDSALRLYATQVDEDILASVRSYGAAILPGLDCERIWCDTKVLRFFLKGSDSGRTPA